MTFSEGEAELLNFLVTRGIVKKLDINRNCSILSSLANIKILLGMNYLVIFLLHV